MSESDLAKLSLNFSRDFVAQDGRGLFYLLQAERETYLDHLDFLANLRLDHGVQISVSYDEFSPDAGESDVSPKTVTRILPNSLGPEGQMLLNYLGNGDHQKCVDIVYAFFVENGWINHPLTSPNAIYGDRVRQPLCTASYFRGLSLLAGARAQEVCNPKEWTDAALSESQSQVRLQLGQLKAEMTSKDKLLQNQLAEFKRKVQQSDQDRHQIRRIFMQGLRLASKRNDAHRNIWSSKYASTYDHFTNQLQYKSAVALWTNRAKSHETSASNSLKLLLGSGIGFAVVAILVVIYVGPNIADAFVSTKCSMSGTPPVKKCIQGFSPLGPLVLSTILLVSSLCLWLLRMVNKVYLSERHLHLDALERKAFAETYLALRESAAVTEDHEAIVLNALFRPTQDGMVKDDAPTLDASVASMLAKRMAL